MGWVRTFRNNQFIALNDGSTNNNIQVLAELGRFDESLLKRITTSASLKIVGNAIPSLGKGQKMDLKATSIEVLGDSDAEAYPLQPKKHSLEFLREKAHLRFRTNTFGSVFRVRHSLAYAVHKFYNDKGFVYMHTPIVTTSDWILKFLFLIMIAFLQNFNCFSIGKPFETVLDYKFQFFY